MGDKKERKKANGNTDWKTSSGCLLAEIGRMIDYEMTIILRTYYPIHTLYYVG